MTNNDLKFHHLKLLLAGIFDFLFDFLFKYVNFVISLLFVKMYVESF